jgi:nucleotide-binding universal stress UspA family protein
MQTTVAARKTTVGDDSRRMVPGLSADMTILVATDGSRGGDAALRFASRFASRGGARLVVLTVGCCGEDLSGPPTAAERRALEEKHERRAMRILDSVSRGARSAGGPAEFRFVVARRPDQIPETIARESDRIKADLVVVGSEGRDTLQEWVVGGVALRLIYVASRPVTVVRPPKRRKPALLKPA